jgi:ribonuclease-3
MRPKNLDYYRRALVHKSVQRNVRREQEARKSVLDYYTMSNERLEFLGDSVLGLIVSNYLFDKYPTKDEGFMTRTKTKLVCGKNCAKLAQSLDLGNHILMSRNVQKTSNVKILEDAFEAFVGAIYKDLGFKFAQAFVYRLIEENLVINDMLEDNNYKDILLRYCQSEAKPLPEYITIKEEGPPHERLFTVSVQVGTDHWGTGTPGTSKKDAEQMAAKAAIEKLDQKLVATLRERDILKIKPV